MTHVLTVAMFVLSFVAAASAASVPIAYRVDAKALKAAVSGTTLTFELFADAACTQLHHSATAAIDDLDFVAR